MSSEYHEDGVIRCTVKFGWGIEVLVSTFQTVADDIKCHFQRMVGDFANLSPFWEAMARKQSFLGTYLTNLLLKEV